MVSESKGEVDNDSIEYLKEDIETLKEQITQHREGMTMALASLQNSIDDSKKSIPKALVKKTPETVIFRCFELIALGAALFSFSTIYSSGSVNHVLMALSGFTFMCIMPVIYMAIVRDKKHIYGRKGLVILSCMPFSYLALLSLGWLTDPLSGSAAMAGLLFGPLIALLFL